jgi:hypothetical protein
LILSVPGIDVVCFAPTLRQSKQLMDQIRDAVKNHPEFKNMRIEEDQAIRLVLRGPDGTLRSVTALPSTHKVKRKRGVVVAVVVWCLFPLPPACQPHARMDGKKRYASVNRCSTTNFSIHIHLIDRWSIFFLVTGDGRLFVTIALIQRSTCHHHQT